MKKRTAGLALAAVTGLSALSATPALAVTAGPYENCTAAAADGVYNIQRGDYRYAEALDNGGVDGIGCEDDSKPLTEIVVAPPMPTPPPTQEPTTPPMPTDQMSGGMPRGGVDAGVTPDQGSDLGSVALAGGLVLAAAGAGAYVVRRRSGDHA